MASYSDTSKPEDIERHRQRFCQLLRDTNRENIDYVIEDLETIGFFTAPASVRNHFNFDGGLLLHSLNVYDMAISLRKSILEVRPEAADELDDASIAIAALLHDTCKANIYRKVQRARKNEIGIYEKFNEYQLDYSGLPVGHGEKSVIMLLRSGLDLDDDEILAIRWHMGPWGLAPQNREQEDSFRLAQTTSALVPLIHMADSMAVNFLERPSKQ